MNDTHGHGAGDQLLRAVGERLRMAAGEAATVARLGGDEFAVLLTLPDAPPGRAAEVAAARLLAAVDAPFAVTTGGAEDGPAAQVRVGLSLGLALAPADAADSSELLRRADAALYRAKAEGRGRFRRFSPEMDPRAGSRRSPARLEAELREAIARGELVSHYQPVCRIRDGRLVGFEALARWPAGAGRAAVSPAEFIPVAEQAGLIGPLTEVLLLQACRAALAWPPAVTLSFNVSGVQLRGGHIAQLVRRALAETGLPARRLQLEVPEAALAGDGAPLRELLGELRGLGVGLALDDFGSAHADLREVQALPFDTIKVDGRFVRRMQSDPGARKLLSAVIQLGVALDRRVIAEGVERAAEAEFLDRLGCPFGQGWLYGRPFSAEDAREFARQHGSRALDNPRRAA